MNTKILPTLLSIVMVMSLVGCLKTKEYKEQLKQSKTPVEPTENIEPTTPKENNIDPVSAIDMSLEPNEIGEILILMYHGIADQESEWQRTPENLRKDLEYMYQNKYRVVSLNDYAKGDIKTAAGYTPIILTFDDGRKNNFDISVNNGEYKIDQNCAVGILEEFKAKYPDFNLTATFFVNPQPFGQEEYTDYKLKWLIENGYDVGNHTYSHGKLESLTGKDIQTQIGSLNKEINKYIPDYAIETLALPNGGNTSEEYVKDTLEGEYETVKYKNIAVVDVGWRPAYSPFDTCNDFTNLFRVTASEMNTENCGMYDYFKKFEEGTMEKFISDGNPDVVTIPKRHTEYINKTMVGDRILNIYDEQ